MNSFIPSKLAVSLVLALGATLTTGPGAGQGAGLGVADAVGAPALIAQPTAPRSASATIATSREARLLVGEWRMQRLQVGRPGERDDVDFSGRISFTPGGTVAVQARNPDENAPETPFARHGYESYYGTYASNARTGRVAFEVRSSLVRELEGERLVRNYRVSKRTLVLTPADPRDGFRVTYRRVR